MLMPQQLGQMASVVHSILFMQLLLVALPSQEKYSVQKVQQVVSHIVLQMKNGPIPVQAQAVERAIPVVFISIS